MPKTYGRWLVFDVESIGLHGEAFAVGYVIMDDGVEVKSGYWSCPPQHACGQDSDREWVAANVPPLHAELQTTGEVLDKFWELWKSERFKGTTLWSDVNWPVETGLLSQAVKMNWAERCWDGPFPLYDVKAVRAAAGLPPRSDQTTGAAPHHPLHDARASAVSLLEAVAFLRGKGIIPRFVDYGK